MKKLLLQLTFLLLPFFALAQVNAPLYKDFEKDVKSELHVYKFNDHLYVLSQPIDEEHRDLVAVDDKMQVVWRIDIPGISYSTSKFKDHILAVTTTSKKNSTTLTGYLIDEKNGNILLQKVIYEEPRGRGFTLISQRSEDGSYFKILVRGYGVGSGEKGFHETKDLALVDVNEKLECTVSRLEVPEGYYVGEVCNERGDIFIFSCLEDNKVKVVKYDAGNNTPSAPIVQDINLHDKDDLKYSNEAIVPSKTDRSVVYLTLTHRNNSKERALTVSKLDFNAHTAKITHVVLDKDHIKNLEKSFVPLDKDMNKPVIGRGADLSIQHAEEYNGTLLVALSDPSMGIYQTDASDKGLNGANTGHYLGASAIIINAFDQNLQPKFEQVLPVSYASVKILNEAYHAAANVYYILATNGNGVAYSQLDLTTGKILKFEMLKPEKWQAIDNDALWFNDSFIIPYRRPVFGVFNGLKHNIDLQLINY